MPWSIPGYLVPARPAGKCRLGRGEALLSGAGNAIEIYSELRSRWEYGHVAAFIAWFLGFTLLIFGALQEVESSSTGT